MRTVPAISHLAAGLFAGRAFDRVVRRTVALFTAWKGRQAAAELAHLDGRMLSDIGLSRGDVTGAIELPMSQDPTARLAALVRDRRSAQHAQKRDAARSWS